MDPNQPTEIDPEVLANNPILLLALLAFMALFLTFLTATLLSWIWLAIRKYQGKPILPVENWQPRVWGLADVLIVLILVVLSQFAGLAFANRVLGIPVGGGEAESVSLGFAALVSLGYLFVIAFFCAWLMLRYRVGLTHIGMPAKRWWYMFKVGVIAGVAGLPLVYVGNAITALAMKVPYKHPLLEAMKEDGSGGSYLLAFFAAAIVAPLAEEFLFRGILQGWLQSLQFSSIPASVLGASFRQRCDPQNILFYSPKSGCGPVQGQWPDDLANSLTIAIAQSPGDASNEQDPYQSPASSVIEARLVESDAGLADGDRSQQKPPIWPAIVAGILFGFAHWGYGLSFIPLSFLGIYLGLLYRATQSIWPCVIVHFMLNSSSMLALGVAILVEQAS